MHLSPTLAVALLVVAASVTSCQTVYYGAMEKVGVHKRDILVDRIEEARDDQEEAKEQFKTALERFSEVTGFQGGRLQEVYERLDKELKRSESKAEDVHGSIDAVEDVADALFREWEKELDQYSSDSLRRESERTLRDTRNRYQRLIGAMQRAESRIGPVLDTFRDQVLFLKHNLNAQAIASLQSELSTIEDDVERLIREMETSIAEADTFIRQMSGT